MYKKIFIISTIIVFLVNISFIQIYTDPTYIGWITNLLYIICLGLITPYIYKRATKAELTYIGAMLLGLAFHTLFIDNIKTPISDSFKWIFLVFIIVASRVYKTPKIIFFILITFFVAHSVISIIENHLLTHFFDYTYLEDFEDYIDTSDFRSFGLMQHPLYAANVTIIVISFILTNNNINKFLKIALLIIGTYAIFCFNSRAAMIIWTGILFYRLILYNQKPIYAISLFVLLFLFFLSDVTALIEQNANIFGRLSESATLSDDSSLTRVMSFVFFWDEKWSLDNIVFGGRVLYMPGTDLSLENGILLSIAWWGWIVGVLKVILELIISYQCLTHYNRKDKFILLISCWGTAFANNNSINTFVLTFFIVSFLSFESLRYDKMKPELRSLKLKLFLKKVTAIK